MGRILAIDYGKVRTGIAVTDELQIIASGLTTVLTKELLEFLSSYVKNETVEIMNELAVKKTRLCAAESIINEQKNRINYLEKLPKQLHYELLKKPLTLLRTYLYQQIKK